MNPSSKIRVLPDSFTGLEIEHPVIRMAVRFTLATGVRISECLGLKVEGIRAAADGILIREYIEIPVTRKGSAKCKRPQTGTRLIPLPKYLRMELAEYLVTTLHATEGWLFPSPRQHEGERQQEPRRRQAVSRWWHEWQVAHGWSETFTWHNLRDTAASRWLEAGMTLVEVQLLLGHRSSATTAIYLHTTVQKVADKMERILSEIELRGERPPAGVHTAGSAGSAPAPATIEPKPEEEL